MTLNLLGNLLSYYTIMGLLTFCMFYWDKRAARLNEKRVPEVWLMVASTIFGWIGGVLAMKFVRHKNRKKTFIAKMVLAVLANLVIVYMMIKGHPIK